MTTQTEALKLAHEELKHIKTWCLRSIGIGLVNENVLSKIEESLAQPEQGYTTKRNVWTGNATHKCNVCGRDDFRSEHAAKFHKCEAVEEPEPHSQDRWLDIQLPDTTPPQRTWVGLTDEDIKKHYQNQEWLDGVRFAEDKLKEKNK